MKGDSYDRYQSIKNGFNQLIVEEVITTANVGENDLFVLGCSTSEVVGGLIGKNSSQEVGMVIVETLRAILRPKNIHLAIQGCEHLNRVQLLSVKRLDYINQKKSQQCPSCMQAVLAQLPLSSCSMSLLKWSTQQQKLASILATQQSACNVKHVQIPIRPLSSPRRRPCHSSGITAQIYWWSSCALRTISKSYNKLKKPPSKKEKACFGVLFLCQRSCYCLPLSFRVLFFTIFSHSILWQLFLLPKASFFW